MCAIIGLGMGALAVFTGVFAYWLSLQLAWYTDTPWQIWSAIFAANMIGSAIRGFTKAFKRCYGESCDNRNRPN